jgi:prepilin-type N-terminal cleavage/methylation domain-containing protein
MKNNAGFTFIELLVVVGIILALVGGGIAAFIGFNDRQKVVVAAKNLQTLMRSAQTKARAGEGAEACRPNSLRGYEVVRVGSDAVMNRICVNSGDVVTSTTERSRLSLSDVSVNPSNLRVEFLSLRGGVRVPGDVFPVVVTLTGNIGMNVYQFRIGSIGNIDDGAFQ